MVKKPQDLLEFFRRTSDETGSTPDVELEKTPRMMVLRRSQLVVAAAAAGLGVLLAFLIGLGVGGGSAEEGLVGGVGVWVIRVVSYEDDERGRRYAKMVMSQLERLGLGDEVNLRRLVSDRKLVVTLGSWLRHPGGNADAEKLLAHVREARGRGRQDQPFAGADFWRIRR
ncbi:MAG: hypothetical protein ACYTEZ_09330 [Planctomycetota bacterium]|jgi:hypothetical protein